MTDIGDNMLPGDETSTTSAEPNTIVVEPSDQRVEGGTRDERRDERTRMKLREVEHERDRYRDALVPHVRAAVESAARPHLSDPAALWLLPDLDPLTLLDEDMAVDDTKVSAAVASLRERLPSTARRFAGDADGGARGVTASSSTWAQVLKP